MYNFYTISEIILMTFLSNLAKQGCLTKNDPALVPSKTSWNILK